VLKIDLSAIQSNWLSLKGIAKGASVAGVIKANAYGLGAAQVGRALYNAGCREFFFASIDEAIAGRSFLPRDSLIYLLGSSVSGNEMLLIQFQIIPVLNSLSAINSWAKINSQLSIAAPSVIKLNTGMTRFGLDDKEFEILCNDPVLIAKVSPVLLMSHLACADEPEHSLNHIQLKKFIRSAARIKLQLPTIRLSLANSSGIFLGEQWHFDLMRPGAALYGINPTPTLTNPMSSVVKLTLPIRQVRTLTEPSTLGYGALAALGEGARVAVVAGGYADGLNRTLGLRPEGLLNGQLVHAIGRISMDAMMFDVSVLDFPDEVLLDAEIEVINEQFSLDYLSKKNKLLGYEVLTSLGNRFTRSYIGSA
jgi:alanine racemase